MTGDQDDMGARIRAVLPTRWFPDVAPVLDGLVASLAWAWAWSYSLATYVGLQSRLATATGVWIDLIALDFFGARVTRGPSETDDTLRQRIGVELTRERGTRAAVVASLTSLTGRAPVIFEPARTSDTGGWGGIEAASAGFAYGAAGGWGSLALPFQFFVTAFRPSGGGAANVGGWGSGAGGYGEGSIEFAALSDIESPIDDAAIEAAIADVIPAATIAWTHITHRGQ